jgi:hypothetical protein
MLPESKRAVLISGGLQIRIETTQRMCLIVDQGFAEPKAMTTISACGHGWHC